VLTVASRVLFGVLFLMALCAPASASSYAWRITKDHWSPSDEAAFERFVVSMGESDCSTVTECMADRNANPYRGSDPSGLTFRGDCADFPYYLRSYFAWKNGLPFAFTDKVSPVNGVGDARHSKEGNVIVSRQSVLTPRAGALPNFNSIKTRIRDWVYSATFRTHPDLNGGMDSDFYPVRIARDAIRPGTVIYDINAHVVVVFKVDPDGVIHWVDASPDNVVRRGVYNRGIPRTHPKLGSGFKNWRPVKLVGATRQPDGTLVGGHIALTKNKDLPDYSTEQYVGTDPSKDGDWRGGKWIHGGNEHRYYDYVRHALADGVHVKDPMLDLRLGLRGICSMAQERVKFVDAARKDDVDEQEHPKRLPANIFEANGDWATYASPVKDARLKRSVVELVDRMREYGDLYYAWDDTLAFSGLNLRMDLAQIWDDEVEACDIRYRNSKGWKVNLTLADVFARAFDLSFDPYHCPELRWGAPKGKELQSCPSYEVDTNWKTGEQKEVTGEKYDWYEAQKYLRNVTDPDIAFSTDFGLSRLRMFGPKKTLRNTPDVDLHAFIEGITIRRPPHMQQQAQAR
jgi:hypothetical protein